MARVWCTRAVVMLAALAVVGGCSDSGGTDPQPEGGPVPETADQAAPVPSPTADPAPPPVEPGGDTGRDTDNTESSTGDIVTDPRVVTVGPALATGLETPWDVDFLHDGSALVSLRDSGQVIRVHEGGVTPVMADGPEGAVPEVTHEREDGLLGLAQGPEGGLYLYLTTPTDNRVVRYDLAGDQLTDPSVIISGIPREATHDGGRLAFGPDGYLYVTTGDARQPDLAQDTESLAGKILRLRPDGSPAPDNPFDNEVWSYGHRNVQGLGWTSDGRMYASEFGSDQFDELNVIEAGGNYGWPEIEGWAGNPDFVDPVVTWGTDEASPSGIAVTDHGVWLSALRGERLWFVPLGPDGGVGEPRDFDLGLGRLRAVVADPEGALWVITSNTDGRGEPDDQDDQIVRLEVS